MSASSSAIITTGLKRLGVYLKTKHLVNMSTKHPMDEDENCKADLCRCYHEQMPLPGEQAAADDAVQMLQRG